MVFFWGLGGMGTFSLCLGELGLWSSGCLDGFFASPLVSWLNVMDLFLFSSV